MKVIKTKKLYAILTFFLIASIIFNSKTNIAANTTYSNANKAVDIVESLTDYSKDKAILNKSDKIYEDAFEEKLTVVEKSGYVYLFTKDIKLKSIIFMGENESQWLVFDKSCSDNFKVSAIEKFTHKISPDFFDEYEFDIISSKYGENEDEFYSFELWQKFNDNFYTGDKIAIIVNSNGELESYIYVNSEFDKNKIYREQTNSIKEDTAIKYAYNVLNDTVKRLEKMESEKTDVEKSGNDIIISDSGEIHRIDERNNMPEYIIKIDDISIHDINTYKKIFNGNICWVVNISNVKTNRIWGMNFEVVLDAQTGDTISVNYTR